MHLQHRIATGILALIPLIALPAAALTLDTVIEPFTGSDTAVRVVLDGDVDGSVRITLSIEEGLGDIRGLFLNFADDIDLSGLQVSGLHVEDYDVGPLSALGGGNNLNGGGSPCPCDFAIEFGSPGIGKDDLMSVEVILSLGTVDLLNQLGEQAFGVRVTSVGWDEAGRGGSSKLAGTVPVPEPGTAALLGMGLVGCAVLGRRSVGARTRR